MHLKGDRDRTGVAGRSEVEELIHIFHFDRSGELGMDYGGGAGEAV